MKDPVRFLGVSIVLSVFLAGTIDFGNRPAWANVHVSATDTTPYSRGKSGNEVAFLLSGGIQLYQILLSSQDLPGCNFEPSCSHFGREAVSRFGFQGVLMTSDRLLRCNGLSTSGSVDRQSA
ncbi:MAG: membrane protein insertion efficiency factor YidD [Candidatus Latescibacterota bacterium]|nr:MAG: membrane protein insertion efficiency factor YidD [Candidatus Latescibacterota bacterium]